MADMECGVGEDLVVAPALRLSEHCPKRLNAFQGPRVVEVHTCGHAEQIKKSSLVLK
jgi:hypothetical protein